MISNQMNNTKKTESKWLRDWLILVCVFGIVSWVMTFQTGFHKFQVLVKRGKTVNGRITAKEPNNHRLVRYTYKVGSKQYKDAGSSNDYAFDNIKVGEKIIVCYNPANPQQSIIGNPRFLLQNELAFHLLIPMVFPIFFLVSKAKQLRRTADKSR